MENKAQFLKLGNVVEASTTGWIWNFEGVEILDPSINYSKKGRVAVVYGYSPTFLKGAAVLFKEKKVAKGLRLWRKSSVKVAK